MFFFKLLSFCLGGATLGGTGAAIYYAMSLKNNLEEDKQTKSVEGTDGREEVQQETVQRVEQSQSQPQQETPASPVPMPMGLIESGTEESSISRTK